ncbi:hypothetical protein [Vibrio taketomensis]|uniref:hypothetical protein n=1 Tax=Vibrio taketomensis TaxID=2572923 RepID=UPI0013894F85|nr:hypothetical protein [Vibrio taketomensis]
MNKWVLSLLCSVLLSGCSSHTQPHAENFLVACDATRPTIEINGQYYASDQVAITLKPQNLITVSCHADGYYSAAILIDTKSSTVGTLDSIGSFLFVLPILGARSDDVWQLTSNEIYLSLEPLSLERNAALPVLIKQVKNR